MSAGLRLPARRSAGSLAILSVVLAYASVAQGTGVNQAAHFGLVKALAHGTAIVSPETGRKATVDLAWHGGHYYSSKAPGLAGFTVAPYFLADHLGVLAVAGRVTEARRDQVALWLVGLFGAVIPTGILLILLRSEAERLEPGFGAAAAVTAGLCTLLFPFATVVFDHALSASLGFASFFVVRKRSPSVSPAFWSGLLAGLAVCTEYPLGIVAALIALYVLTDHNRLRRFAAYAGGLSLGLVPLGLYDWWAFGKPQRLSYAYAILTPGRTGHDVLGENSKGFFGVGVPQRGAALELLFSRIGLLTVTPVVVAGAVGLLLLWRKGVRREVGLAIAVTLAFLVYNSGYYLLFGGGTPGPRFLVPMLPFLALGFATAYRSLAWPTIGLAIPSLLIMLGVTATDPIYAASWHWVHNVVDGSAAGSGIWPRVPLVVFTGAAVALCCRATPVNRPSARDLLGAVLSFCAYLVAAFEGPRLVGTDPKLLVVEVGAAGLVVVVWQRRWGRPEREFRSRPET